jgi:alanine-glyoxylate transaminase/serine-glyoxylate transaminase/serine-pyruvate transaminase
VLDALAQPTIGHLDPAFVELIEDVAGMLRSVFRTANPATLPVSATGSGGMDALIVNFVEAGDRVVVGANGLFGERLTDALGRAGAEVVRVEAEWGRAIEPERLVEAVPGADAVCIVHGETSTGVCQPLDGLGEACREADALLLVDCVTSLTGQPVLLDEWGVDAAFSGSQKCLNAPPGLAPFSAGPRAIEKLRARREPPRSWFFDLSLVLGYWDAEGGRVYHHTAPINMVYALGEALRIVLEEGLEERWERHRRAHQALRGALAELGLERLAPDGEELWPLLAVRLPDGVEDAAIRGRLLTEHGIEIAGSLGPLAGRAWRIGVMGEGARAEPQERLVRALAELMGRDAVPALERLEAEWAAAPTV